MDNCRAYRDVSGGPQLWFAETDEPWLEIIAPYRIANRWLRLTWRSGLYGPVCRLVVRYMEQTKDGPRTRDIFLPSAPFGRGQFIFHVPAGTQRLLLSPIDQQGEFRFELETVERISLASVFLRAARQSFGRAALAYCALWVARYRDLRLLLTDALAEKSLSTFAAWRHAGIRQPDIEFDGPRPNADLRVRFVVDPGQSSAKATNDAVIALAADILQEGAEGVDIALLLAHDMRQQIDCNMLSIDCYLLQSNCEIEALTLGLAKEDLIVKVPSGTRLQPNAIAMLRGAAQRYPTADLIYGDNDHIDGQDPIIRPGFDRLLLRSFDYIGSAAIWRVGAVVGQSFNRRARTEAQIEIESADDARLADPARAVEGRSLSRFLFSFPNSVPGSNVKIQKNIDNSPDGSVEVDILIPTRDRLDLLKPCVDSILAKTLGPFHLSILDNDSTKAETLAYFAELRSDPRITVRKLPGPFNFSRICNKGAEQSSQRTLIFLNNDTTVIDAEWTLRLAAMAGLPEVGAVGAKLLYPDGRVQHAGVTAGLFGGAGHFEHGMSRDDPGFFGRAGVPHQLAAVTGACLAVTRDKFFEVGGFDEQNLPIDLNDIDLCFRLMGRGYLTVQLGDCHLYHHESASRGYSRETEELYKVEREYFRSRWMKVLRSDQYFSPNLSLYAVVARLG